jgi:hypothetical protein
MEEGILPDMVPVRQCAKWWEWHAAETGLKNTVVNQDVATDHRPDCFRQQILIDMIVFHPLGRVGAQQGRDRWQDAANTAPHACQ